MVARIRSGKSVKGAINYNEKKVSEGHATFIYAMGYPKEAEELSFHEKVHRLEHLTKLNTRTETNCLHVSLNFDPSERLAKEKLIQIAEMYLERINFADQPALIYEHHDAAHQHIHIVSTNIQRDGKRIPLHNIGKERSEKARKEIEDKFGLIRAGDKQRKELRPLRPVNLEKVQYGKMETKRAITNIVTQVISQYKFTSLPGFNAVLKQFNVTADRGAEDSRIFQKKGLLYSLLDSNGNKIGIPIKGSSIYGKPTIKGLEERYEVNRKLRQAHKETLKFEIQKVIRDKPTEDGFIQQLKIKGIDVVLRCNDQNFMYGITYVDHKFKTVFNGSDLGKDFSAAALREQWAAGEGKHTVRTETHRRPKLKDETSGENKGTDLITVITDAGSTYNYVPWQLKKRKRKKRKI